MYVDIKQTKLIIKVSMHATVFNKELLMRRRLFSAIKTITFFKEICRIYSNVSFALSPCYCR